MESFNGKLREAKVLIEAWRCHYNTMRPHSALGYRPPAPEAIAPAEACSATLRSPLLAQKHTYGLEHPQPVRSE